MRTILIVALIALVPLASAALPAPAPVVAAGFNFLSPVLVVPAGTTVQWTSAALPHTVTSAADLSAAIGGDADGAYRLNIPTGSASLTFGAPGEYAYFCEFHVAFGMVGVIEVV